MVFRESWGTGLFLLAGLLSAFLLLVSSGEATVLRYLPVEELISEADRVVHGRVGSVESRWSESRQAIYTEVVLEVIEFFKGEPQGGNVHFTFLGGECDGIRLYYEYQPTFVRDEEVLVFLRDRAGTPALLMGLSQGVWRVTTSPAGPLDPVFVRSVRGISLQQTAAGAIEHFDPDSVPATYRATELRKLVAVDPVGPGREQSEVAR
ncbi:hypothetical protein JXQ70_19080 [bacterium]|nr:hypothetical protein [bacterium]